MATLAHISGVAIARTPDQLRQWLSAVRGQGKTVALVPTMGALHAGHAALMQRAGQQADAVVASIFVNPMQFGPNEDFSRYPRQLPADCALCGENGVQIIYAPDPATVYPAGFQTRVELTHLPTRWDGASRPGHFAGVATVVLKLLNVAQADIAIFGEKDWQQLQVITQMARDLDHITAIVGAPIVREADGLALSSRNVYLTADERRRAPAIQLALQELAALAAAGERDVLNLQAILSKRITDAGGRIDYAALVDPQSLVPLVQLDRPARALVAAWFGSPKLLDNCAIVPRAGV